ncbi:hypothetical protein PBI_ROPE_68 [Mycobacterium phage Rope]|nr:methyltransferase [Mycobacterium phage Papyrus]YP_009614293.1 methyltransferase [Mycobacterium phage Send513]AMB17282.1 hypothetical protein SEA_WEISS13_68 [Mycobacterium phage Weiss13]ARW57155.1 hypothetical protein SEA_ZENON_70 [Mycobacterium phage Zenon]AYQ98642.1 hypothetical protein SEA_RIPARIAN_70 [Mycobacterium phage Riparian]QCG78173.1 hypothetical protein SEA_CANDLE_66 [Mycobacterium phage Candle]QNN99727.1 hypothetical protein PBI_ROPE_68 [Mycobacterium phage Rope]
MTVETTEKTGRGGARGPRVFKDTPTPRDRVISESLADKVKELTGKTISPEDCRAVKFSLSRWYEDPATKELLNDMDAQLKKAKAKEKAEKARKLLEEAQRELEDAEEDDDSDDASDEDTQAAAADEDDEDDEDSLFDDEDEDDKVSATF